MGEARTGGGPAALYRERRDRFAGLATEAGTRAARLANWRLAAFVGAVVAAAGWLWWSSPLLVALSAALFALFAGLVVAYNRAERARRRFDALRRYGAEGLARLARDWAALPVRHTVRAEPDHPYANDLDLFGRASLCHLLDTASTAAGERALAGWLLESAEPAVVLGRQAAATELAPQIDWRDELRVLAEGTGDGRVDPTEFLAWAESEPLLARHRGLLWLARVSPVCLWAALAAQWAGWLPLPVWLVFLVVNGAVGLRLLGGAIFRLAAARSAEAAFRGYADAFAWLTAATFGAPALRDVQTRLAVEGEPASRLMRRLFNLTRFIVTPSAIFYFPVQALTLWDIHLLAAFEGWQATAGRRARAWLAALGDAEALAALATLAHDEPAWTWPAVDAARDRFRGERVAHPLLPGAVRVPNDVEVGPPGTFLLVTGSNMSGKSTLLRAVGVNAVLAGAGAPVCAAGLAMPPVRLWTSMRVADSLERGVSYFMAELQRLKLVVDAARDGDAAAGGARVLYLLDEILQGTNTAERQIAARRIIRFLVARGALGAVSTHDLTLADSPALAETARPVHFTERFTRDAAGPHLAFDYTMRPGLARSTNALHLMELVGLDVDDAGGEG